MNAILAVLGFVVVAALAYVAYNIFKRKKVEIHASVDRKHARVKVKVDKKSKLDFAMGEAVDTLTGEKKYLLLQNLSQTQHLQIWSPSTDILIDDIEVLYVNMYTDDDGVSWTEYQLRDPEGKIYSLEVSKDDGEICVSLSQKRKFHVLGEAGAQFKEFWQNDQDSRIEAMKIGLEGNNYYYSDDYICTYTPDKQTGQKPAKCEIYEFETEDELNTLTIENWDLEEGEFEISLGKSIQMSDITVQPMDTLASV